jgi:hypothetical protein
MNSDDMRPPLKAHAQWWVYIHIEGIQVIGGPEGVLLAFD